MTRCPTGCRTKTIPCAAAGRATSGCPRTDRRATTIEIGRYPAPPGSWAPARLFLGGIRFRCRLRYRRRRRRCPVLVESLLLVRCEHLAERSILTADQIADRRRQRRPRIA